MTVSKNTPVDVTIREQSLTRKWNSLVLRLSGLAKASPAFEKSKADRPEYSEISVGHCKLISITVLTDANGEPVLWSTPTCKLVEPNRGTNDWLNQL